VRGARRGLRLLPSSIAPPFCWQRFVSPSHVLDMLAATGWTSKPEVRGTSLFPAATRPSVVSSRLSDGYLR
jgi:hypothetical protein